MRTINQVFIRLFSGVLLIAVSVPSFAQNGARIWLTTACYQLNFSVQDKLMLDEHYKVSYIVKASDGTVYVSEKEGLAENIELSHAKFPEDFFVQGSQVRASSNCAQGEKYSWHIYINAKKIDSGTFEFSRRKSMSQK